MTRRDRTTGKPKHRPRPASERGPHVGRIAWRDSYTRIAILGGVSVLLLFVLGLLGYRWYDNNIGKPNETVLRVNGESYSLGYFADRLGAFWLSNPNLTQGFLEPALLTRLEEEAVMVKMAEERGYDLSDEAVLAHIADDLGVAPGGSDSPFDTLYRARLRQTGLSETDYRRMARAGLAESLLLADVQQDVSDTVETLTLRVILLQSEDAAEAIVERIEEGEDMAELARTESLDITSREEDGMLPETPRRLYPENVRTALAEAEEGDLAGPVQVQANWWIIRVEDINPAGEVREVDREQLAELELDDLVREAREEADVRRSLNDSQVRWAYNNLSIPVGGN